VLAWPQALLLWLNHMSVADSLWDVNMNAAALGYDLLER
jgi:hypothetical protein